MARLSDQQFHELLKSEGGFSRKEESGRAPKTGHMAADWGSGMSYSGVAGPEDIGRFRQEHSQTLSAPGAYFGGWLADDESQPTGTRTDLDTSKRFKTRAKAYEHGKAHGQEAFFDLEKAARSEDFDGDVAIPYGPRLPWRGTGRSAEEQRGALREKNTAYRTAVREHLSARDEQPRTHEDVRRAGERIGDAVYEAEQTKDRLSRR